MNWSEIEFEPAYANRDFSFQIQQAKYREKYLFTLWSFFPYDWTKQMSEEIRCLANALPKTEAERVFVGMEIEELPYTEGFYFPIFRSGESAQDFFNSEVFSRTYRAENENEP